MKIVKEPAPIICERCEKVFKAKYAFNAIVSNPPFSKKQRYWNAYKA